ncbi:MAG: DUF222 domain-containing protein, partial [Actinomycetales bacterium]
TASPGSGTTPHNTPADGTTADGVDLDGGSGSHIAAGQEARPPVLGVQARPPVLGAQDVRAMTTALTGLRRDDEADAIDQIGVLEELSSAVCAAQARATADLASMRHAAEEAAGLSREDHGKGLAGEVALARRESPSRGSRHLGLATTLDRELPHTLALMEQGQVSEWRATLLARETVGLSVEDRRTVDAALAPELPTFGDRQVRAQARKLAMELDTDATAARREHEESRRCVSLRPGQGSMAYVTAHLPMTEAVRVHASLLAQAATIINDGEADGRTPGQIAADLLVEHVTGTATTEPRDVDLTIVMTDETLAGGDVPAWLTGHGPVPADVARDRVREARETFFRRLWTDPSSGGVVSMESRSREFTGELRRLILIRDDICRTPYCTGRAVHVDHSVDHADGGPTSASNGNGLCARCNYAKQHPGWRHANGTDGRLDVYTPTGHRYTVPRSPFPYQKRPPAPPMTDDRYAALQHRVAERVAHNRRNERPADGGSLDLHRPRRSTTSGPNISGSTGSGSNGSGSTRSGPKRPGSSGSGSTDGDDPPQ